MTHIARRVGLVAVAFLLAMPAGLAQTGDRRDGRFGAGGDDDVTRGQALAESFIKRDGVKQARYLSREQTAAEFRDDVAVPNPFHGGPSSGVERPPRDRLREREQFIRFRPALLRLGHVG